MNIIITGSVCTGKTTLAKILSRILHYKYIDVNGIIKTHKEVVAGYDRKRKTKEIDTNKLNKVLLKIIKKEKNSIVDSHLSHYLPRKRVDLCIVCKTDLKTLKKRLERRTYSPLKIRENLDAEIFDVCAIEAAERGHNIFVFYADKPIKKQLQTLLSHILKSEGAHSLKDKPKRSAKQA